MSTRTLRLTVLSAVIYLLAGGLAASTATAEPTACDRMSITATGGGLLPEDVVATGGSLVVAGSVRGAGGKRVARLGRYDGSHWRTLVSRAVDTDAGFMALGGTKATGLWAVGFRQTLTAMRPLIVRQDADTGAWVDKAVPRGGKVSTLIDVAAHERSSAWAVGYRYDGPGSYRPYAVRWDGKRWTLANPAIGRGERGMLSAVSTTRTGGTWVGGSITRGRMEQPYLARRAGGTWKQVGLPDTGTGSITDLLVPGPSSGWAVGYRVGGDGHHPLVLRWDGRAWATVTPPDLPGEAVLTALDIEEGRVTVGGSAWHAASGRLRPFLAYHEGDGWRVELLKAFAHDGLITGLDGGSSVGRDLGHGMVTSGCGTPAAAARRASATVAKAHPPEALAPAPAAMPAAPEPVIMAAAAVRMVDRARAAGLPTTGHTYGAVIADFDDDGRLDIFLGGHAAEAALYLDRGATFHRRSDAFSHGDRHGCAAADVDGSGLPDLYCVFGGARGSGVKANELWLDPGVGDLHTSPDVGGATEILSRGREAAFIDADDDGHLDLVVGTQTDRVDGLPSVNRLYRWIAPGRFSLVRNPGIAPASGVREVDSADVDRDGRMDLLVVTDSPKAAGRTSGTRLYRNTAGGFRDVNRAMGVTAMGERDAELVRLDSDRSPDLVQVSQDRIRISLQRNGRFARVYEHALTDGVAVAAGDADGDGDLDLYVLQQKRSRATTDLVLFNRGGRSYRVVAAPSRSGGTADGVFAIDHDGNGLTDFLVLNGRGGPKGPIQLVSFFR